MPVLIDVVVLFLPSNCPLVQHVAIQYFPKKPYCRSPKKKKLHWQQMKTELVQFHLHVIEHQHLHVNVAKSLDTELSGKLSRYIRQ